MKVARRRWVVRTGSVDCDAWGIANDAMRSEAIRLLVELGLKAKGK